MMLGHSNDILLVMMNGESIVRYSKRSGWLQTLRNCINTFIIEKKSEFTNVDYVLSLFMYSS